jgi:plasmid stabilization system protein ParE
MRDGENMEVVNEKDPSYCESIQRVNGRGGGNYVRGKEMINGMLGLLANGREKAARDLVYIFFIFKLNQFGSVRVGRFRHTKTKNETRYFLKYFNQFNQFFFYWFSFFY